MHAGDARTTHGATPGRQSAVASRDPAVASELFRAVAYVTMCPRSAASPEVLAQRERMVAAHEGDGAYCAYLKRNEGKGRVAPTAQDVFQPELQRVSELTDAQWRLVGRAVA
jgi:hypothetical protein